MVKNRVFRRETLYFTFFKKISRKNCKVYINEHDSWNTNLLLNMIQFRIIHLNNSHYIREILLHFRG